MLSIFLMVANIHPSLHSFLYHRSSYTQGRRVGRLGGEGGVAPWTSRQFMAGPHTVRQTARVLTCSKMNGSNLELPVGPDVHVTALWEEVGGTWREPVQSHNKIT